MARDMGNVISNFCLMVVAGFGIWMMTSSDVISGWDNFIWAFFAYLFVFIGALLGTLRYGLDNNSQHLADAHLFCAWVGSTVGLALICTQVFLIYGYEPYQWIFLILAAVCFVGHFIFGHDEKSAINDAAFGVSLLAIFFVCFMEADYYGVGGSAAIFLGRMKGERNRSGGESGDLYKDDGFIMLFAVGMFCFTQTIAGTTLLDMVDI